MFPRTIEVEHADRGNEFTRGLLFFSSVSLCVGGIGFAIAETTPFALAASGLGIAIYVWLLKSEPVIRYYKVVVITLHEDYFAYSPEGPGRWMKAYKWSEIERMWLSTEIEERDFVFLTVRRRGMKDVSIPILLSQLESREALLAAFEEWKINAA
jgi:hypothetical protein